MKIPEEITTNLEKISSIGEIPLDDLKAEHEEIFNSWIKESTEFGDDLERHKYVIRMLSGRYVSRPKVKPLDVIPIGGDLIRTSKKGNLYTSVYVLHDKKVKRISINGNNCKMIEDINLFNLYSGVKLGTLKDSNDLSADDRANFINPVQLDVSSDEIVKALGLPTVTIMEAPKKLSKKGADTYTVKTDWRIIRGFIRRAVQHIDPELPEDSYGYYMITDDSIDLNQVSTDGKPQVGLRVNMNPYLMKFPEDATCDFLCLIEQGKKGLWVTGVSAIGVIVPPGGDN